MGGYRNGRPFMSLAGIIGVIAGAAVVLGIGASVAPENSEYAWCVWVGRGIAGIGVVAALIAIWVM